MDRIDFSKMNLGDMMGQVQKMAEQAKKDLKKEVLK